MSFDSGKQPPDELDLLVGSTVAGKYHIDRLIGRGGMGAVFQATNAAIGKRVALKFLGPLTSKDSDAATRFQREAEAASLAESPHIVQIFDSGRSEHGLPFLVMELLTGEDLREGISAIISVKIPEPQYDSQNKFRLCNAEVEGLVNSLIGAKLEEFCENNPKIASVICEDSAESSRD